MARKRRSVEDEHPATPAVYDWTREPFVLDIKDMARILRLSVDTIGRELRAGTMAPAPMPKAGRTSKYRWSRADVQAFLEGGYRKHDPAGARRLRIARLR